MKHIYKICISLLAVLFFLSFKAADILVEEDDVPVIIITIEEGSVEEMNDSQDHSVSCTGRMDIIVPEGFRYVDRPDMELSGLYDLELTIRGRGNSSWEQPKKPYKIKLENKEDLFGMGSNKHWVLLANYLDATHLKNRFTCWLSEKMGFAFTPECLPVQVYMDGDYLGYYLLAEQVRVGKNRLEIDELSKNDDDPETISGGYLIQGGQQTFNSPSKFITEHGVILANHTPNFDVNDDGYENDAQKTYIRNHLKEFEDALFGENYSNDLGLNYRDYIDLKSMIDYWLIQIVSCNVDAYSTGSHYFYKVRDTYENGNMVKMGKIYFGPIWDFDKAWGEDKTGSRYSDEERFAMLEGFSLEDPWLNAMLYDEDFLAQIRNRWPVLKGYLEDLIADDGLIDQYYREGKNAQAADFALWHEDMENIYEQEIKDLKERIAYRIAWVDQNLASIGSMIVRIDFMVDEKLAFHRYLRKADDAYVPMYEPEKEGYIFLGWLDEEGNPVEEGNADRDRVYTADFVSKEDAIKVDEIIFSNRNVYTVLSNASYRTRYELLPEDAQDKTISWSSSDETIATVNENGIVLLQKTGKVRIMVELASGASDYYDLTILEEQAPFESFELINDEMTLLSGSHAFLDYRVIPESGAFDYCSYESSDPDTVSVDSLGLVRALKPGTAVITVSMVYIDDHYQEYVVKQYCTITVEDEIQPEPDYYYYCEKGEGTIWTKGNTGTLDFVFKRSEEDEKTFESFAGLKIDDRDLSSSAYDILRGSLKLSMKGSYLNTLETGKHTVTVCFADGKTVTATFRIQADKDDYVLPVTGID